MAQPEISAVNIDEYKSMTSVKGVYSGEVSSAALHLYPEEGINQGERVPRQVTGYRIFYGTRVLYE